MNPTTPHTFNSDKYPDLTAKIKAIWNQSVDRLGEGTTRPNPQANPATRFKLTDAEERGYQMKQKRLAARKGAITINSPADGKPLRWNKGQKRWDDVKEDLNKSIRRGVKYGMRALSGWGVFDKDSPAKVVSKNKSYSDATIKLLSRGSGKVSLHSPAGLQKRVLDREMKKRGIGLKKTDPGDVKESTRPNPQANPATRFKLTDAEERGYQMKQNRKEDAKSSSTKDILRKELMKQRKQQVGEDYQTAGRAEQTKATISNLKNRASDPRTKGKLEWKDKLARARANRNAERRDTQTLYGKGGKIMPSEVVGLGHRSRPSKVR